ncbi:hypothetical protein GTCCBUS3UF5_17950 [Geobacillus thermoleovorans CCB_US3_UF5]|uniref:Uncharacterized protein n=2 Tax=Geobacillus thermoleovorans group TaxID=1505648 RepID=U2YB40_GEOKU|nr:hypothetical protein GTCCBUS3UF5_17950 [Geobacillus thermoleovorans CCB_US3_UF5]GAD14123.1 hypothetical protein GBL_2340 [Geobacillus kaustophilus GBlys]GAJ59094.1 hypothetical protein B23_2318 [Geobacillus thermoleovorans B23]
MLSDGTVVFFSFSFFGPHEVEALLIFNDFHLVFVSLFFHCFGRRLKPLYA